MLRCFTQVLTKLFTEWLCCVRLVMKVWWHQVCLVFLQRCSFCRSLGMLSLSCCWNVKGASTRCWHRLFKRRMSWCALMMQPRWHQVGLVGLPIPLVEVTYLLSLTFALLLKCQRDIVLGNIFVHVNGICGESCLLDPMSLQRILPWMSSSTLWWKLNTRGQNVIINVDMLQWYLSI